MNTDNIPTETVQPSTLSVPVPSPGEGKVTQYAVVLNSFDVDTKAYYTYTLEDAIATRDSLQTQTGHDWKIGIILK